MLEHWSSHRFPELGGVCGLINLGFIRNIYILGVMEAT